MADPVFESQQLENFRKRLENSLKFQCACCYETKAVSQDVGEVALYRPKSALIARQIEKKAAPYVICKSCTNAPPDVRDRRVLECLASNGLFG